MGSIGSAETSVLNQAMPFNKPKDWKIQKASDGPVTFRRCHPSENHSESVSQESKIVLD
jgi:hypothetical protein